MIPQAFITEWSNHVPWQTNEQVEQDLVICRALVEIFSDDFLASSLAFRGGTALHKLYLSPQPRYSEDIDLVQIRPEPIKDTLLQLQKRLKFLGKCSVEQKKNNNTLKYHFDSEIQPIQPLRLKVETNCREHFTVLGYQNLPLTVKSSWYQGNCNVTTYKLEELLGTKIRALYQRRKGRDLYDLYKALSQFPNIDEKNILECYKVYMQFVVKQPPTKKQYLQNLEAKIQDSEFLGDITALIRPTVKYDQQIAYKLIKEKLIEKL
jgi:predicted nucleotidyltransferase component of viral defense system